MRDRERRREENSRLRNVDEEKGKLTRNKYEAPIDVEMKEEALYTCTQLG